MTWMIQLAQRERNFSELRNYTIFGISDDDGNKKVREILKL
jgi:hypothetical protein